MFSSKKALHSKPRNVIELKGATRLRKLRLLMYLLFIGYLPFGVFIVSIINSEKISGIIVFIYFLLFGFVTAINSFSKCPRCKNIYTWKGLYANGFTTKCLHCGLSIRKKDLSID